MLLNFNSIKVRLERYERCRITSRKSYFNSIKVRLEHRYGFASPVREWLFQFHKGTIRTEHRNT